MSITETRIANQHAVIQLFDAVGPKLVPKCLAILGLLEPIAALVDAEGLIVTDLLHAVAAQLLTVERSLRLTHLISADLPSFDVANNVAAHLLALDIAHALAAIDLDRLGAVTAATILDCDSLGALLALHLEALAAVLTFDALNLESLGATAPTATLETLRLTAATAPLTLETLGLAATTAPLALNALSLTAVATAARSGFCAVAMSAAAAGLGRRRGCDRQRRNAGRQE